MDFIASYFVVGIRVKRSGNVSQRAVIPSISIRACFKAALYFHGVTAYGRTVFTGDLLGEGWPRPVSIC